MAFDFALDDAGVVSPGFVDLLDFVEVSSFFLSILCCRSFVDIILAFL